MIRSLAVTLRCAVATLLLGFAAAASPTWAEDPPATPSQDLRRALGSQATAEQRLAAGRRLAETDLLPDPEGVARLAVLLTGESLDVAGALARRAIEAGIRDEIRASLRRTARAGLETHKAGDPTWFGWMAFALEVGERPHVAPPPMAPAALSDAEAYDAPEFRVGDRGRHDPTDEEWALHVRLADLLDAADSDDPAVSRPAMDGLVKSGAEAAPFLLAWAAPRPSTPPGLVGRRARAVCVLGMIGDRRAVPVLSKVVADDTEPGWVRVAAAYALGDLGDVAAVPALAHVLFYLGDRHRPRDSWDFPGEGNIDVREADWADADYYAIDCGAADALIRLGVRNAAEWLIRERLDPRKGRWRIRVIQDALDAIRRSFEGAPSSYRPDGSVPGRMAAWEELVLWWAKGPPAKRKAEEDDPRWLAAAKETADLLGQKSVMELQSAKKALALYGPLAWKTLVAAIPEAKGKVHRAEIAAALGTLRDRRAVDTLLALTADPVPNVRAVAAESLAAFHGNAADPLVTGTSTATDSDVLRRWLELLDDSEEGPRASAMKALTVVEPRDDVRAAVDAHASATHPENQFGDFRLAEEIVRLVQTGEGLDAVLAHLTEPQIFRRRFVWELLRASLRLPEEAFDATPSPEKTKPLDRATAKAALDARRAMR